MDDLDRLLEDIWARLRRGVVDRRSPFHAPAIATLGADGSPAVRTVILREVAPSQRLLCVHSDRRAGKITDLQRDARAAFHVYDTAKHVQVRLACRVTLHTDDRLADEAWGALSTGAREIYRVQPDPGSPVSDPGDASCPVQDDEGRGYFALLRAQVTRIEWLELRRDGHLRAGFDWLDERWQGTWLVP